MLIGRLTTLNPDAERAATLLNLLDVVDRCISLIGSTLIVAADLQLVNQASRSIKSYREHFRDFLQAMHRYCRFDRQL